jgi:hypothetical protein
MVPREERWHGAWLGWAGRRSLIFVSGIPTLFAAYERSGWSLIVTSPQIASEASVGA